jgi:formylglycine-generating enzyme required for sulfatase activity
MKVFSGILKGALVVVGAMLLTAFTINATDNLGNFSDSALGGMVAGIMGEPPRCPEGMTLVDTADGGFCIDIYEASPSQECLYGEPASEYESVANINQNNCIPVSEEGTQPWRHISQTQAVSACIKAGKRLPTNDEWYLAAVGTPDAIASDESGCNLDSNWQPSRPGETGSSNTCVSYYGAYDMVGNVWEWVADTVRNGEYKGVTVPPSGFVTDVDEAGVAITTDGKQPKEVFGSDRFWSNPSQVAGVFRGGYWASKTDGGLYTLFAQVPPSFVGEGVGFRCVK